MSSYRGLCTSLAATAGSQTMIAHICGPIWKIMMLHCSVYSMHAGKKICESKKRKIGFKRLRRVRRGGRFTLNIYDGERLIALWYAPNTLDFAKVIVYRTVCRHTLQINAVVGRQASKQVCSMHASIRTSRSCLA